MNGAAPQRAAGKPWLLVDVATQQLVWHAATGGDTRAFSVSTAERGVGQRNGSNQTPRGRHVVRARIGEGQPHGAVFVGRRPTGEVWSPALTAEAPQRDFILTRILWLSGLERGVNRLGNVDSMRRYIYIHGTPDDQPMGVPRSHGCVRMRNDDVVWLFAHTPAGSEVQIRPQGIVGEERSVC